ncbi:MAG: hypothetical protein K2Q22_05430, partial [Cytophagales bacterium]|nr:hypothetical protein [Cytophagales bacterium]
MKYFKIFVVLFVWYLSLLKTQAQTYVGTVTSQNVLVSYTPNGSKLYSSCGQDVELRFNILGTPLQTPNYTYPLYPYLKLRLNPSFKANWNYAYGNSQVQFVQTGNENGQDYVVLKVNYFSAGTATTPLMVRANYSNCGDMTSIPTVTLTSIAEVFVLSSTAPGSVISNPSNFTSSCSSLVINKQPTVTSTLPLPIDVTDAVKGGVYTRSYNFILSDSKATNYN